MNDKKDCLWGCIENHCLSADSVFREDNCIHASRLCGTCGKKYWLRGNPSCPHCLNEEYIDIKTGRLGEDKTKYSDLD